MATNRRDFLRRTAAATGAGLTLGMFPPAIRKALAIRPHRRTGTIQDVEHIVVLMQENRSFDHYFGTLDGVRGFGDRFPIPVPNSDGINRKTVWFQNNAATGGAPHVVAPFRLDTRAHFELMRVTGTPHGFADADAAWGDGIMSQWPRYKRDHSMGFFTEDDIPFQFAMAQAFTICDAYHCSIMSSTNPNRLFLWTGTNDPLRLGGGPAINNDYDNLEHDPDGGYTWATYCERLQAAGVSWQIYENMDDNFTDNSVAGFKTFRDAYHDRPGSNPELKKRGLSTRDLDLLLDDVLHDKLPQVSWIVATAEGSEHPGPSSPAQGADYTAKVLEALTANPEVWNRTALFVNFDENDGFFDHVPPPAAPTYVTYDPEPSRAVLAGASTVSTVGEYHEFLVANPSDEARALLHRPYGLGPRVPMYVLSPWSRGGWVNSQVADHTSVIQFIEKRFGVREPNISAWRRAVCGDLTSAFDFADPHNTHYAESLPDTTELADRARALPATTTPPTPDLPRLPAQQRGVRPSRALPYELHVNAQVRSGSVALTFVNSGEAGACFHVYDRKHLNAAPRRYTVEAGKRLDGTWAAADDDGAYDLWVLGPNGFHRHFTGGAVAGGPEIRVAYEPREGKVLVKLRNEGRDDVTFKVKSNAYRHEQETVCVRRGDSEHRSWSLEKSGNWYDFTVTGDDRGRFSRRFAGRVETGRDSFSDPAMGGPAAGDQD
jgi:phospholipase C